MNFAIEKNKQINLRPKKRHKRHHPQNLRRVLFPPKDGWELLEIHREEVESVVMGRRELTEAALLSALPCPFP